MPRFIPLLLCCVLCTPSLYGQSTVPEYKPRKVIPTAIRPITEPNIISGADANIPPNDLVIGIVHNGEARAYRIDQLTGPSREIINDTLGGSAIAATW